MRVAGRSPVPSRAARLALGATAVVLGAVLGGVRLLSSAATPPAGSPGTSPASPGQRPRSDSPRPSGTDDLSVPTPPSLPPVPPPPPPPSRPPSSTPAPGLPPREAGRLREQAEGKIGRARRLAVQGEVARAVVAHRSAAEVLDRLTARNGEAAVGPAREDVRRILAQHEAALVRTLEQADPAARAAAVWALSELDGERFAAAILARTHDDSPEVRLESVRALSRSARASGAGGGGGEGAAGTAGVRGRLVEMISRDKDPSVRAEALRGVSGLSGGQNVAVIAGLADREPSVQIAALEALRRMDPERWAGSARRVAELAGSPEAPLSSAAIGTLGGLGEAADPDALAAAADALGAALGRREPEIALAAAGALARLGRRERPLPPPTPSPSPGTAARERPLPETPPELRGAVEALQRAALGGDGALSRASAMALGAMGTAEAARFLLECIGKDLGTGPDGGGKISRSLRRDCIAALGSLPRTRETIEALRALLAPPAASPAMPAASPGAPAGVKDPQAGAAAVEALVALDAREAAPDLRALAERAPAPLRTLAVEAAVKLGDPAAASILLQDLSAGDPGVRLAAAAALGRLGSIAGIPFLIALLEDESVAVRRGAAEALAGATGMRFGYDPGASEAARQRAIQFWRFWWMGQSSAFKPRKKP